MLKNAKNLEILKKAAIFQIFSTVMFQIIKIGVSESYNIRWNNRWLWEICKTVL